MAETDVDITTDYEKDFVASVKQVLWILQLHGHGIEAC